jgi:hypothetical protein
MILRSTTLLLACCQAFAEVSPPSSEMRETFKLGEHYEKVRTVDDFPVVSSAKVPDAALEEAAHVVRKMLVNRPDIIRKLAENRIRLGIMAVCERTTDLPEHSDLDPAAFWNRRARGLGASRKRPCVSCGEENLLHNPGDPYNTESIMVHEFAHAIHMMAVNDLDPTFDQRLKTTYESAMKKGLWKGLYAAENHFEYWAEAAQSWFDTNRENDAIHNHVNTRQELIDYDPALAALCREVFGDNEWRYVRSDDPSRKKEAHLKDLDRSKLRPFVWSAEEQAAYEALEKKE